jgi:hypothetical protein
MVIQKQAEFLALAAGKQPMQVQAIRQRDEGRSASCQDISRSMNMP